MSSSSNRGFMAATDQARFDPIIGEFVEDLRLKGIAERRIPCFPGPARHFLTWLTCTATPPETVDSAVIERFLQHDCTCWSGAPTLGQRYRWRKRRSSPQVMRFVRFLEQTRRVATPGDLDDNLRILDAFLARLRRRGYACKTIRSYRSACTNLVVWLHLSRLRLRELNRDVLVRFHNRTFACSIPDLFRGEVPRPHGDTQAYGAQVGRFLGYLVSTGHIGPLEPPVREPTLPDPLEKFRTWLECHRGITARSIHRHIRHIAAILPDLGDEPRAYDATLVRRTLFRHIEHRSRHYAKRLTGAMRMRTSSALKRPFSGQRRHHPGTAASRSCTSCTPWRPGCTPKTPATRSPDVMPLAPCLAGGRRRIHYRSRTSRRSSRRRLPFGQRAPSPR